MFLVVCSSFCDAIAAGSDSFACDAVEKRGGLHLAIAWQALGIRRTNVAESLLVRREKKGEVLIVRTYPSSPPSFCEGVDEEGQREMRDCCARELLVLEEP
jgi:hypothetical protein